MIKAYRLVGWPDLDPARNRTAYRRLLGEMSQRHLPVDQLCARSGLPRAEVSRLLDDLLARGLVHCREESPPGSLEHSLERWLKRAVQAWQSR